MARRLLDCQRVHRVADATTLRRTRSARLAPRSRHNRADEEVAAELERSVGRAQADPAHEMFTAMGMGGFAERTGRELVATGATVRQRAAEAADQLTE